MTESKFVAVFIFEEIFLGKLLRVCGTGSVSRAWDAAWWCRISKYRTYFQKHHSKNQVCTCQQYILCTTLLTESTSRLVSRRGRGVT